MAQGSLAPSAVFVQIGKAEHVEAITGGFAWDWGKEWTPGAGRLSGYWEASLSLWRHPAPDGQGSARLGLVAFTPVFRFTLDGDSPWFLEGGIGVTWMNTLYATDAKQFSTRFNFGDQIAVGWRFGTGLRQELSLRAIHYSNGDIKAPNPGENFIQLRYSYPLP